MSLTANCNTYRFADLAIAAPDLPRCELLERRCQDNWLLRSRANAGDSFRLVCEWQLPHLPISKATVPRGLAYHRSNPDPVGSSAVRCSGLELNFRAAYSPVEHRC